MREWVPGQSERMTVGDVWRWSDAYFWKDIFMGHRMVTAQCTGEAKRPGFWMFEVDICVPGKTRDSRHPVPGYKTGELIERAFKTLLKGGAERRIWTEDETGRSVRASKYLGNDEHERVMSTEGDAPPHAAVRCAPGTRRSKKKRKTSGSRQLKARRGRPGIKLRP